MKMKMRIEIVRRQNKVAVQADCGECQFTSDFSSLEIAQKVHRLLKRWSKLPFEIFISLYEPLIDERENFCVWKEYFDSEPDIENAKALVKKIVSFWEGVLKRDRPRIATITG